MLYPLSFSFALLLFLLAAPCPAPPAYPTGHAPRLLLTSRAPLKAKPWVPGWGFYPRAPQTWLRYHEHLRGLSTHTDPRVVFFGDSLTWEWSGPTGRAVWHRRLALLRTANYGVGGDTTRQALWRIGAGELDGLHPRVVVLLIGTDNLGDALGDSTDAEVAQGVGAVVRALRRRLPHAKVLLLGLLPRQDASYCRRVQAVNRPLAALDDGQGVRFLDMGPRFLLGPGRINHVLYTHDQLHLTTSGYQTWADAMCPRLAEMLTPRRSSLGAANLFASRPITSSITYHNQPQPEDRNR